MPSVCISFVIWDVELSPVCKISDVELTTKTTGLGLLLNESRATEIRPAFIDAMKTAYEECLTRILLIWKIGVVDDIQLVQ